MRRYGVRLSHLEDGSRVESTVNIEAESQRHAKGIALVMYGRDGTRVVSVYPQCYLEYRQRLFAWTPKNSQDGTYSAIEYAPIGPGARSGKATRWNPVQEVRLRTSGSAKMQAEKWYNAAKAKDTRAE